ncbi:hypothetical protein [Roseicella sp. DB1501]|uniref:hypothetical protein n=1 Tax=Roseicella sp. DB1501 TaxID=2730925 RepID=UPI0014912FFD|nr:hypothetical protein [Roseicella sp. DB1501]NOG73371.1 hypothetical protein [Roseicella sp. DB1501]
MLQSLHASFVLGFHGCDRHVGEALLSGAAFAPSENVYDWLGSGIYFWEANPLRGLEFAQELKVRRVGRPNAIKDPFVVGAVIELGFCLDLTSSAGISAVKAAHTDFAAYMQTAGEPMPTNFLGDDLLKRSLDCAVVNHLHGVRTKLGRPAHDSVRGVFLEGGRIYETSGFFNKTHIQLCIRNPGCIKGVFRVAEELLSA